jgi:hypothetical protein
VNGKKSPKDRNRATLKASTTDFSNPLLEGADDAEIAFGNPILSRAASAMMASSPTHDMSHVEDCDFDFYDKVPMDNTVGWLMRREGKQAAKVEEQQMNYFKGYVGHKRGQMVDLGSEVYTSWAFVFDMPQRGDAEKTIKELLAEKHGKKSMLTGYERQHKQRPASKAEFKRQQEAERSVRIAQKAWEHPGQKIPCEVWQICHMLWKYDFHIEHSFSPLGDQVGQHHNPYLSPWEPRCERYGL